MSYKLGLREEAIKLRKLGYSIKEVSEEMGIAKSTSSLWLRDIKLSLQAEKRLEERRVIGQYKSRASILAKAEKQKNIRLKRAQQTLSNLIISKELAMLCCSLLFWCEGNKGTNDRFVRFTNSDPKLVKLFLSFLRTGFAIDETKFRILMHLHTYHDEIKQKNFWSKNTNIPSSQFHKTYWKLNTGKKKHKDYQGCIAISYYSSELAKELSALYNSLEQRGVG